MLCVRLREFEKFVIARFCVFVNFHARFCESQNLMCFVPSLRENKRSEIF
ncbi:hypothetical protein [Helicobacter sp. 23-1045]